MEAIPSAKVDAAYTLLSEDRMQPAGQLLILRANSTAEVQKYLQTEPLQSHGGIAPWKLFELRLAQHTVDSELEDEGESLEDYFTSDVHDPLLFLSMVKDMSPTATKKATLVANEARKRTVKESMKFHLEAARTGQEATPAVPAAESGAQFLPLYRNASRVAMLGELLRIDNECAQHGKQKKKLHGPEGQEREQGREQDREQEQSEVLGQVLLFNAHSRADALRYLRRDPVACSTVMLPSMSPEGKKEVLFDTSVSVRDQRSYSGKHAGELFCLGQRRPSWLITLSLNLLCCLYCVPLVATRRGERAGCKRTAPPHAPLLCRERGARPGKLTVSCTVAQCNSYAETSTSQPSFRFPLYSIVHLLVDPA
jgi:hypothetical protein